LYQDLKRYGSGPVEQFIRANNTSPFPQERGEILREEMTANEAALLDRIWQTYGKLDGLALSRITHQEGTPWTQVTRQSGAYQPIDNATIESHYRILRDRNQHSSPISAFE